MTIRRARSFAFGTTLSGIAQARQLTDWPGRDYHVKLVFLSLRSAARMSTPNPRPFRDPDLLQVGEALRRAADSATALALRTGTPLYVWRGGRIVNIGTAVSTEANSASKTTANS